MAVNLPPQYHDAEAEYKKARTPDEKLAALKKMWAILPKHKASEKVQADLKTKISEVTDEVEAVKTGPKKATASYKIPRQGAGHHRPPRRAERGQEPPAPEADQGHAGGRPVPVHHARAGPGDDGLGGRPRAAHRPAADHRRLLRAATSPTSPAPPTPRC